MVIIIVYCQYAIEILLIFIQNSPDFRKTNCGRQSSLSVTLSRNALTSCQSSCAPERRHLGGRLRSLSGKLSGWKLALLPFPFDTFTLSRSIKSW